MSSTGSGPPLTAGFRVGHWTEPSGVTGCTVVLPPRGNVASCDIRGSSPSTREIEHLHVDRKMTEIHGILLTGGSAFGLAAAEGVVEWLAERDIGYRTPLTTVPIVPAAVIFDWAAGDPSLRPNREAGRAACDAATGEDVPRGPIGAGAGATVGKWAGREFMVPGGIGTAHVSERGRSVAALAVVNAIGDVVADGETVAGTTAPDPSYNPPPAPERELPANTVLVVVTTDAPLDKRQARWLAERGSDGVTVAVRPAHTRYDGDITFAVAASPDASSRPGSVEAVELDVLGFLATRAVSSAIRNAVAVAG